ncbi:hypothetical protein HG442_000530 [Candidatus Gracilibacteria bacterium]|nr:hypothetical protein [Candidatus Gracilibacteria bacterium]
MIFESHVLVLFVVGIIEIIVLFLWWQKRITASSVLGLSSALYLLSVIIIKFPLYSGLHMTTVPTMQWELFETMRFYIAWKDISVVFFQILGRALIYIPAGFLIFAWLRKMPFLGFVGAIIFPVLIEFLRFSRNMMMWEQTGFSWGQHFILDNIFFGVMGSIFGFLLYFAVEYFCRQDFPRAIFHFFKKSH